jgi:hypothetical protein
MPKSILMFERFAYASLAFGLLTGLVQTLSDPDVLSSFAERTADAVLPVTVYAVLMALITLTFAALIWAAARRRRNWARWVYTLLFPLGIGWAIYDWDASDPAWFRGLDLTVYLLDAAALFFLWFRQDSASWFSLSTRRTG